MCGVGGVVKNKNKGGAEIIIVQDSVAENSSSRSQPSNPDLPHYPFPQPHSVLRPVVRLQRQGIQEQCLAPRGTYGGNPKHTPANNSRDGHAASVIFPTGITAMCVLEGSRLMV